MSSNRYGTFTDENIDEALTDLLDEEPERYFRCKLHILWWNKGRAIVLDGPHTKRRIELPNRESLGQTFDGDIAVVELHGAFKENEPSFGKVEGVIERCQDVGYQMFICKTDKNSTKLMCPVDSRSTKIKVITHNGWDSDNDMVSLLQFTDNYSGRLKLKKKVKAEDNKLFCVRCLKWNQGQTFPLGYAEDVYSFKEPSTYKKIFNVPGPFPSFIREEAEFLKPHESSRCKDGTHLYTFTVDEANTKVFDDALSIQKCLKHDGCWEVWIHITNLASIISRESGIDNEAKMRGVAFYGWSKGSQQGLMVPKEVLLQCSLTEKNERLAVSAVFHSRRIFAEGDSSAVLLTKIKISRNLYFGEVQEYIYMRNNQDFKTGTAMNISQQIYQLWKVFWKLRIARLGTTALYHQMNLSDYCDISNKILSKVLIEEAMITANRIFANFLCNKSMEFIGRCQEPPSSVVQNSSASGIWHAMGLSIYQSSCFKEVEIPECRKKQVDLKSISVRENVKDAICKEIDARHHETAILLMCCDDLHPSFLPGVMNYRSMQENAGDFVHRMKDDCLPHFSLKLPCYLKSTSPLRNYVDLVNQRQIIAAVEGRQSQIPSDLISQASEIMCTKNFAKREKQVDEYQSALDDFKLCSALDGQKCHMLSASVIELRYGFLEFAWTNSKGNPSFSFVPQFLQATNRETVNWGRTLFTWILRFYDVECFGTAFQSMMGAEENLVTILKSNWGPFKQKLENNSLEENIEDLGRKLKSQPESKPLHNEIPDYGTCNGIHHQRKFQLEMTPGSLLYFMALPFVKSYPPKLMPQMLSLDSDFDVCLIHRRQLDVFPVGNLTQQLCSSSTHVWMDLVVKEARHCAVFDGNVIMLCNLSVTFETSTGFFKLSMDFCEERFFKFTPGDLVCLHQSKREGSKSSGWVIHAVITNVEYKEMLTVHFDYETASVYSSNVVNLEEASVTCEFFPISVVHKRMLKALMLADKSFTSPVIQQLRSGRVGNDNIENHLSRRMEDLDDKLIDGFELNSTQKEQIWFALERKISLIQGPPGTGKSVLGAHLAYYFWKQSDALQTKERVLYCGPSNKSVDVVAGYLTKANLSGMNVVRVYASSMEECDYPVPIKPKRTQVAKDDVSKPDDRLADIALHKIIRQRGEHAGKIRSFDNNYRYERPSQEFCTLKKYKEYKSLIEKAKLEMLNDADVILCTCSTAGSKLISQVKFAQCIIDECGMCSEPETLIPITASMHESLQIVLIGDHKQLCPIVKCKEAKALSRSMFERLSEHASMLTTQYRMHFEICQFPSSEFYDGKLETATETRKRRSEPLFGRSAIHFFRCQGTELEEPDSYSKYNLEEIAAVNSIVKQLITLHDVPPKNIMVLSPYLGQCNRLRKKLKETLKTLARNSFVSIQDGEPHVGSVVTSQGSEADYVILSTVRSCHMHENCSYDKVWMYKRLGFLTDEHQINVAITRAKLGMYIVGNDNLLKVHPVWRRLLEHYQSKQAIDDVEEDDEDESFTYSSESFDYESYDEINNAYDPDDPYNDFY